MSKTRKRKSPELTTNGNHETNIDEFSTMCNGFVSKAAELTNAFLANSKAYEKQLDELKLAREKELASVKETHEEQLTKLKTVQIEESAKHKSAHAKDVSKLNSDITELKQNAITLQAKYAADMAELKNTNADRKNEITMLLQSTLDSEVRATKAEAHNHELNLQVEKLQSEISLKSDLEDKEHDLEVVFETAKREADNAKQLQEKCDALEMQLQESEKQKQHFEVQMYDAYAQLSHQDSQSTQAIASLQHDLHGAENLLREKDQLISNYQAELEKKEDALNHQKQEMKGYRANHESDLRYIAGLKDQIKGFEAQLDDIRERSSTSTIQATPRGYRPTLFPQLTGDAGKITKAVTRESWYPSP